MSAGLASSPIRRAHPLLVLLLQGLDEGHTRLRCTRPAQAAARVGPGRLQTPWRHRGTAVRGVKSRTGTLHRTRAVLFPLFRLAGCAPLRPAASRPGAPKTHEPAGCRSFCAATVLSPGNQGAVSKHTPSPSAARGERVGKVGALHGKSSEALRMEMLAVTNASERPRTPGRP